MPVMSTVWWAEYLGADGHYVVYPTDCEEQCRMPCADQKVSLVEAVHLGRLQHREHAVMSLCMQPRLPGGSTHLQQGMVLAVLMAAGLSAVMQ